MAAPLASQDETTAAAAAAPEDDAAGSDAKAQELELHQFAPINAFLPTLSQFCLKLECFLRMAQVPYRNRYGLEFSPKGKVPWIRESDGTVTGDSAIIIEKLTRDRGIDMDAGLTVVQRATRRALEGMLEERTYFALLHIHWTMNFPAFVDCTFVGANWFVRSVIAPYVQSKLIRDLQGQGTGRHSNVEVVSMLQEDVQALSDILGDKQFIFGDEPTTVDACAFSVAAVVVYSPFPTGLNPDTDAVPSGIPANIRDMAPDNLVRYVERMRERFWPDWEEVVRGENPREQAATS